MKIIFETEQERSQYLLKLINLLYELLQTSEKTVIAEHLVMEANMAEVKN